MTDAQKRARRRASKPGDSHLGHASTQQTAATHTAVAGDHPPHVRWADLMDRAGDAGCAVLVKHAPGEDGRCKAEKCLGELWPCPPAASVAARLP